MKDIYIDIVDKVARAATATPIVCGNSDYTAVFCFDGDWDDFSTKTARFVINGHPQDVVFDGNRCEIPVLQNCTMLEVGVYAGDIRTSTAAYIKCIKSVTSAGGTPPDPAPDVYNQLMDKLNSIEGAEVDNATIIKDDTGKLRTSVGGYIETLSTTNIYTGELAAQEAMQVNGIYVYAAILQNPAFTLADGEDYTATVNGVTYRGTAFAVNNESLIMFGDYIEEIEINERLLPDLIGIIYSSSSESVDGDATPMCVVYFTAAEQTSTLNIHLSHNDVIAHPVDARCVPEGISGSDGITPHIGTNGNWYIGDEDTGQPAQGDKGDKGDPYTLTAADKATITADVLAALPTWTGGEY